MRNIAFLFIILFSLSASARHDRGISLSVDVLRFFFSQISLRAEFEITDRLSIAASGDFKTRFQPPGIEVPGWRTSISAGAEARYYITGKAARSGFYIAGGTSFCFQNSLDSIIVPLLATAQWLHAYPFALEKKFMRTPNYIFLEIDPVFRLGHTWTINEFLYFDIGGGFEIRTIFAVGDNGGFFLAAPLPVLNASIGYQF